MWRYMAFAIAVALVVVLVAVRLTMPPWPNYLKMGTERWGKQTTVVLFAIALAGAAIAIIVSRL